MKLLLFSALNKILHEVCFLEKAVNLLHTEKYDLCTYTSSPQNKKTYSDFAKGLLICKIPNLPFDENSTCVKIHLTARTIKGTNK